MTLPVVADEKASPFAGIAAAAAAGVTFDESSLTIVNPDLPYEIYETLLASAGRMKRSMSWWIGDLINFGDDLYPDRYSQAMEATGLRYETLSNYAWVCRRVARSRRRDHLSFGVHDAVAALEPSIQVYWLDMAEREGWTTSQVRDAIKSKAAPPAPVIEPGPLSPNAISSTAGALSSVHRTLERIGSGQDVTRELPKAVRALEQAGETLRVAASVPTLLEVAGRLVAAATPMVNAIHETTGEGFHLVPTATLDELRELVKEGGNDE